MSRASDCEQTVIVIGGTGFIGGHIVTEFARSDRQVIIVSRHPPESQAKTRHGALDLCSTDIPRITQFLLAHRPGLIVNASGAVWRTSEERMWAVNSKMVNNIISAIITLPWRPRLIHLGSVYEYAPVPAGTRIDAKTPERPVSAYGRSKLAGTSAVLRATKAGLIDGSVVRLSNVTGAGSPPASLLGSVAERLTKLRGRGPAVMRFGELTGHRDFLDARDVAAAVKLAAGRSALGQMINLGRGEAVHVRRAVEMMVSVSGLPVSIEEAGENQASGNRDAGTDWIEVETLPAWQLLGWRPKVTLLESLRGLWKEVSAA
ncbi:MAG: NAD-dependent epimerase/dehydratase [Streptosporangiaceae bacterium]|nr:NAD-dependent epimerase/dehydratase [Streptosporangiaceae bacterium]